MGTNLACKTILNDISMTPVSNDLIRLLKSPKIEELLHPKSFFDVTRHEGV